MTSVQCRDLAVSRCPRRKGEATSTHLQRYSSVSCLTSTGLSSYMQAATGLLPFLLQMYE